MTPTLSHRALISVFTTVLIAMPAVAPAITIDGALPSADTGQTVRPADGERQLFWSLENRETLDRVLADRIRHGLDRVDFLTPPIEKSDQSALDIAYTHAALRYASALAEGIIDPASLHEIYTIERPTAPIDTPSLSKALRAGRLSAWLESLAPQDASYADLSTAYVDAARQRGSLQGPRIKVGDSLHVGDSTPDVGSIVAQLANNGYLDTTALDALGGSYSLYTPAISRAIRALQQDSGIAVDGVVGPETVAVLNLQPGDRARAIAVALERRRWLSRTPPATRIDVNIASAELRYFRDGTLIDQRKVVVGKPDRETPMLGSPIYRLVANPTWTIPKSIQNTELANIGPDYLQDHNMMMRDGWIVQQPGPDNALGLVKFDMINDHAIYLHDTNAPAFFDRSDRHLSHGCIRVSDALGFAALIAEQEGVGAQWQEAQVSGQYTLVDLPRRIPVRLLYENVTIDDLGKIVFRPDPYRWNPAVATALGFNEAVTPKIDTGTVDVGP
jgi:murein L,D-transpeptidase YcbB/YkuD